ncbi:MAG: bifunctional 4-hydroxy-2-oxoglutarate aldolase/2-dehydro-3-deoxy-phosphogluconate aldolase [Clostridia bacterium]|nr:bifunctional 4-hydroxy-2-oxoglutarate aldolase/2-dehydro-3-deoxy-phosphogluconate aldolase [Clostridia bacterium]
MTDIYTKIFNTGIIPVVVIDDENDALPIAKALIEGGLPSAEITFRTAAAKESIRKISEAYGDQILVGAGTVLTEQQVDDAVEAGAQFIVSPGFSENIVKYCQAKNVTVIPGCSRPTDIEAALRLGLKVVKFFPAEAAGGLAMIKAMSAPYGDIKFMPTGGIDEKNILQYLAFEKVIACGGSFMVNKQWVKDKEFHKITEATRKAVTLMHGFKVEHVGLNANTPEAGEDIISAFVPFGFEVKRGNSGVFLNHDVEIMTKPWYGKAGHICIETNNIKRAEAYLKSKGVKFIEETKNIDSKGNYPAVYIDGDVCGMALHLLQK